MPSISTVTKRLLVGRPFRSDTLEQTLLPKRIALPVFASDAMSSVAYAPEEIFLMLAVGGSTALIFTPWIGLAVAVVMAVVVASYRQNVHAYPSGGGDYEVATVNLGRTAGLVVAAALLVDYVLTVAVSISAAAANVGSAFPFVAHHKVAFAVGAIVLVAAINLRGVRESGISFAVPTYAFIIFTAGMVGWGAIRLSLLGDDLHAESAKYEIIAEQSHLSALAFAFLIARAFTSGCAALTGVEAISNGVPAFRKPKSRNAAATLVMLGGIGVGLMLGILFLARRLGVVFVEDPQMQLANVPADYHQQTLLTQVAATVFDNFPPGYYAMVVVTALILGLAANTAFNGFPVLGSVLAQNSYLPRQFHTRGDRLAFSNGILFLALASIAFVVVFRAESTRLIQLYIVGVFVSFTLSQAGMVRHWTRLLGSDTEPATRARMLRSRVVNTVGFVMTGTVLVIVLITKFTAGAWVAILAMAAAFLLMQAIRRHYDAVAEELAEYEWDGVLPSRTHSIVLVSKLHRPTMRAVAYARATRPDTLEAVTVNVDDKETRRLVEQWERSDITVPLKVIESPYREITRPIVDYVKRIRRTSPRDVVTVFIPEYVVGHWWEQILHNQSALRLKTRLLFQPGVMVTSVPWQLDSAQHARNRMVGLAPGTARRGIGPARGGGER